MKYSVYQQKRCIELRNSLNYLENNYFGAVFQEIDTVHFN